MFDYNSKRFDLKTHSPMTDANTLEATLKNQQWVGGQTPTSADKDAFEALSKAGMVNAETHPNVFAWFALTSKFSDKVKATWAAGGAPAAGGKGKGKGGKKDAGKKKEEVNEDDLFGDDSDDGAAAAAIAAKAKAGKKKEKKPVIAQSLVMFEIKPLDSDTDLDAVAARVLKIGSPETGYYWKTEFKKVPVAFGIFKLIMGVTIEDEKVSVDGLQEQIEAFDDMVQSVDIMAFNKI
jgi:translation elongation factor EF-1beta